MSQLLDLAGIGIGPFNLSLAGMMEKTGLDYKFFDQKNEFLWHSEILFSDSDMQTSFLKDLATSVDPTSPYTFLNYLVETGLFHAFMNTGRSNVTRREFELYCQWACKRMGDHLVFSSPIKEIDFIDDRFVVRSNKETYFAKNISIATGLTPRIPDCALPFVGNTFFHVKGPQLKDLNLENKNVTIIGGGQTGIEVFRNIIAGQWKRPKSIKLLTSRMGLQPLDESPFTNEFFTPNYVDEFFNIDFSTKIDIVSAQKLSSDGNTPHYLEHLYNELYQLKYVHGDDLDFEILASRCLSKVEQRGEGYNLIIENQFTSKNEEIESDIVILCTGFDVAVPAAVEPLRNRIIFDHDARFIVTKDFTIKWDGPKENKIFALNFSRHNHGISEPQTSLMAWRSAVVTNSLMNKSFYNINHYVKNFMSFNENKK